MMVLVRGDRERHPANTSLERTDREAFCGGSSPLQPLNFTVSWLRSVSMGSVDQSSAELIYSKRFATVQ
jgi:hypothetical protein